MKIRELKEFIDLMDPDGEVFVELPNSEEPMEVSMLYDASPAGKDCYIVLGESEDE